MSSCRECFVWFAPSLSQGNNRRGVIELKYQNGLHLPELDLWLDPRVAKPRAFVSHAHADHVARHESVLCSEATGMLLRHRYRMAAARLDEVAFHVPLLRDGYRIRLLPAGHIVGSAMLHITRLADGASLLYTGDFKTRRSRTAGNAVFLEADTLIMETTFGLPKYEFPHTPVVEREILQFVRETLAQDATPVLLGYSLGKAQEALALMAEHQIPVLLHPAAAAMTRACREAGAQGLPEPIEFIGEATPGHVIIAPPHALKTKRFTQLAAKRTAMLSGWALHPGAKFRYRVDAVFPLSDHADHLGLMECVCGVNPRRVITVHGHAKEFAAHLRASGIEAWSASGGDQLEMNLF